MIGASAKDVSIDASSLAIASTGVDSSIPTDSAVVVSPPGLLLCPSDPVTADLMVVVVVDVVVVVVAFVASDGAFTAARLSNGFQLER